MNDNDNGNEIFNVSIAWSTLKRVVGAVHPPVSLPKTSKG